MALEKSLAQFWVMALGKVLAQLLMMVLEKTFGAVVADSFGEGADTAVDDGV